MRPFSSSVLLYSPENTFFSTFFYLSPLSPTASHFTGKMINVNAPQGGNRMSFLKMVNIYYIMIYIVYELIGCELCMPVQAEMSSPVYKVPVHNNLDFLCR